ncbi:signal peptidase II [Acidobacteria bacterium AB60]|nr:signal peptidase II [Acidobacteria bacterium AB60]
MRTLLELHARGLQLRFVGKCLHALPERVARDEDRSARRRGGSRLNFLVPRRLPWLLLISVAVFVVDRLTKIWVAKHILLGGAIPVVPNVLRITHWTNDGAAFSLFADSASPHAVRWGLVTFTLIAAAAVLFALVRLGNRFSVASVALALILAGAIGNVHDRIAYGSVVDFIEVHILNYHWPDFNVADSAVVSGACLLLLDSLRNRETQQETAQNAGDVRSSKEEAGSL